MFARDLCSERDEEERRRKAAGTRKQTRKRHESFARALTLALPTLTKPPHTPHKLHRQPHAR